jgi:peptidoglycan/LPS O-acetylase OafA/YrhL
MSVASEPAVDSLPRFDIPSLDGLRLVSILYVFIAHAGLDHIIPGGFGVTIFFFLSGFLITTLLRREHDRHGAISLKNFYLRRAIRIWPAFYVVLTIGIVLTALELLPGSLQLRSVLAQYLHFANYDGIWHGDGGIVIGTGVYWSLAVEEHFYLLLPLAYVVLRRAGVSSRGVAGVMIAFCATVLAWRCVLVFGLDASTFRTYYASDTRFDSIVFGCVLAVAGNPALDQTTVPERVWKNVLLPVGLLVLLSTFVVRDEQFRETIRYTLQGVGLVPVFVCAIRYPTWWLFRPLNYSWVRFLGALTYSFYLVHFTVLLALADRLPNVHSFPRAVVAMAASFGLAYAIFRLVERPLTPLRHRLARS